MLRKNNKKLLYIFQSLIVSSIVSTLICLLVPIFIQSIYGLNHNITVYYFGNKNWIWLKIVKGYSVENSMPFIPWLLIALIIFLIFLLFYLVKSYVIKIHKK